MSSTDDETNDARSDANAERTALLDVLAEKDREELLQVSLCSPYCGCHNCGDCMRVDAG
jgi:hypothetical protein